MNNLRISFFNSQGCSTEKFSILLAGFPDEYDILIIAETWNCDEMVRRTHPFWLCSSIPRYQARTHNSGGLMVLVSPTIRPLISSTSSSQHHISFKIQNHSFAAVYLPPSLSSHSFSSILQGIMNSECHLLFGDFNVRLGHMVGDTITTHKPKREKLLNLRTSFNLTLQRPSSGNPRCDHLFTTPSLFPSCTYLPHPRIKSDHDVLAFTLPNFLSPTPPAFKIPKYIISTIQFPCNSLSLIESYNTFGPPRDFFLPLLRFGSQQSLVEMDRQSRTSLIDTVDLIITTTIQDIASTCLGEYPPTYPCTSSSPADNPSTSPPTTHQAIRAFRSSMKSVRAMVESRDPHLSPLEDSIQYFSNLYASPQNSYTSSPPHLPSTPPPLPLLLAFTTQLVKKAIKNYPSNKSGGLDGITIKLLKALLNSNASYHLSNLFSLCIVLGVSPSRWNISLITPIPKKTHSKFISDMRPISLTVMFRRLYEILLHNHLLTSAPNFTKIHPLQGGFITKSNTTNHAIIAHEAALRHHHHHIFFDFKSAYDKVSIPLLLKKLQLRTTPPPIISIIYSLFTPQHSQIAINGLISSPFPRDRGLFQGSILSPFLFNVFIDDLAEMIIPRQEYLSALPPFPRLQLFADDVKGAGNTLADIQILADSVSSWAKKNEMELNIEKCGVVSSSLVGVVTIGGRTVRRMDSYHYLGIPFTPKGLDFNSFMLANSEKAASILLLLKAIGHKWSLIMKLTTYKVFVRSRLEYGLPILWSWASNFGSKAKEKFKCYENVQNDFLKWAMPTRSPAHSRAINLSVLGLLPMYERARLAVLRFSYGLSNTDSNQPINILHNFTKSLVINKKSPKDLIIHKLTDPQILQNFNEESKRSSSLTIHRFIKSHTNQILSSLTPSLSKIILPKSRFHQWSYDFSLRLNDDKLREFAIHWRRNLWHFGDGTRRVCCNRVNGDHWFNRGCINRCYHYAQWLSATNDQIYQSLLDLIHIKRLHPDFPESYSIIDHLLNTRQYHLLRTLIPILERLAPMIQNPKWR